MDLEQVFLAFIVVTKHVHSFWGLEAVEDDEAKISKGREPPKSMLES